jgi:hypothetical protein
VDVGHDHASWLDFCVECLEVRAPPEPRRWLDVEGRAGSTR